MLKFVLIVSDSCPEGGFIGRKTFILNGENELKKKLKEVSQYSYSGYTIGIDEKSIHQDECED